MLKFSLKVVVDYPEKELQVNQQTTITISIKDSITGAFVDEPGAKIIGHVDGPKGNSLTIPAIKQAKEGVWHVYLTPTIAGIYKSMITLNGTNVQPNVTKIKCSKSSKAKVGAARTNK